MPPKLELSGALSRASGRAADLVAARTADQPLKLYSGWFCPFVQRTWVALEEKRLPYQYVEVNPYDKSPEFLALNPRGLVPTLAVPTAAGTSRPLYESGILCEYLEDAHPDAPRLLPADPYERARARIWIDFTMKIIVPFYKVLQHTPEKPYSLDDARAEFHEHIRTFAREMSPDGGGPWFLGREFSLVDVALAPWVVRMVAIEHYKAGGSGIPKQGGPGDDEVWRRWRVWSDAIMGRESILATSSSPESYVAVYKRYAEDTTGSQVGQATRKGERLP